MRIGEKAPVFKVTAVCHDGVRQMHSSELQGAWSLITFMPQDQWLQGGCSRVCWQPLVENNIKMLFVQSAASAIAIQRLMSTLPPRSMTLVDPLGWLHRRFGLRRINNTKCRSFLIAPDGALRVHLAYDLSTSDMGLRWELLLAATLKDTTACVIRCESDRCEYFSVLVAGREG